jgi:hypothetical protein
MSVPRRRLAVWLWMALAFVVWNVVFDQVIIDAGRHYIEIASASAGANGPYLNIQDTMRPARSRALWLATGSAGAILLVAFVALRRAGQMRNHEGTKPHEDHEVSSSKRNTS